MCEHCKENAIISLNGIEWLCWKHYCAAMQDKSKEHGMYSCLREKFIEALDWMKL